MPVQAHSLRSYIPRAVVRRPLHPAMTFGGSSSAVRPCKSGMILGLWRIPPCVHCR
ncbi:hypothetical protein EBBID32_7640 [Sphingobium indicum BiD32]|uniref:Uncharacterized protein n=1 Tax=Sphingobium indicum BiD32 TaxID=1301087 RepID=N1MLS4_9SPHN|nr:hypothetical protein EBBID32_7640 [Sphingobium indicum BiD32]